MPGCDLPVWVRAALFVHAVLSGIIITQPREVQHGGDVHGGGREKRDAGAHRTSSRRWVLSAQLDVSAGDRVLLSPQLAIVPLRVSMLDPGHTSDGLAAAARAWLRQREYAVVLAMLESVEVSLEQERGQEVTRVPQLAVVESP